MTTRQLVQILIETITMFRNFLSTSLTDQDVTPESMKTVVDSLSRNGVDLEKFVRRLQSGYPSSEHGQDFEFRRDDVFGIRISSRNGKKFLETSFLVTLLESQR